MSDINEFNLDPLVDLESLEETMTDLDNLWEDFD